MPAGFLGGKGEDRIALCTDDIENLLQPDGIKAVSPSNVEKKILPPPKDVLVSVDIAREVDGGSGALGCAS